MVEQDMRKDTGGRPALRDLFAERRVHVRSGHESRYVVLSRGFQISVALAGLALGALLVTATYKAVSGQFALVSQERSLAALAEEQRKAEQAIAQLAALQQRDEEALQEIARLNHALTAAEPTPEEAAAIPTLQAELDAARTENQELSRQLEEARAAQQDRLSAQSTEVEALRAEVTGLRAELDRVEREAQTLRGAPPAGAQTPDAPETINSDPATVPVPPDVAPTSGDWTTLEPPAEEIRLLQRDLASAEATIDALSADLEAAKGPRPGTGPQRPWSASEADLASLKEQLSAANRRAAQLQVSLAAAPEATPVAEAPPGPPPPMPSPPAPR